MKKWKICYIIITVIMIVMLCISSIYLKCNIDNNSTYTYQIVMWISFILILLIFVSVVLFFIACGIVIIKNAGHNLQECDDELFSHIDKHGKYSGNDKECYKKHIQIINLYYQDNGRVDELVSECEIGRLLARLDFLMTRNLYTENTFTCIYSLLISILASFMCQLLQDERVLGTIGFLVTIFAFCVSILLKYTVRGRLGSYKYLIEEYEKKLLLQKINALEQSLTVTDEDEEILEAKQIVIEELVRLMKKKKGKKRKEKIKNDINCIEQLDLCLGNCSKYYKQKIYINNQECYLVYDYEKGKENNYIGELNLINNQYAILYDILKKYNLISYYQNNS